MQQFRITIIAMFICFILIGAVLVWISQRSAQVGEQLMRERALKAEKLLQS